MSEATFRVQIAALKEGDCKEFTAQVIPSVSASGRSEMFNVDVFRLPKKNPAGYKLQWSRNGKPELPSLKPDIQSKAKEAFKNMAYLTSGYGYSAHNSHTEGMKDMDTLIKVIKELKGLGIIISI